MKTTLLFALLSLSPFLTVQTCSASASAAGDLSGTITLSGAWALYPMVVRWAEEFQKEHPAVHVDIGAGGAGKGMADALTGAVDLGMVSRDIYDQEINQGAWWVSVARDAVVPVVSSSNPVLDRLRAGGLAPDVLKRLWLEPGQITWGDLTGSSCSQPVRVYTRSDACGAAKTWAAYLGGTQEELLGVGVYGDPGLADAVRRDALGIGYNNINYVYDASTTLPVNGLEVLPIDLDGDGRLSDDESFYASRTDMTAAIASGAYPSPPARDLHLVSNGPPKRDVVREFLNWVLTEGQAFVDEAGYIALSSESLSESRARLRRR